MTANSVIDEQNNEWYTSKLYKPFTVTIASPGVVTADYYGLYTNDRVKLFTTGALPTGIVVDTFYYVIPVTAHTFKLTATRDGTAIDTSGTQSGAHSYASEKHGRITPMFRGSR